MSPFGHRAAESIRGNGIDGYPEENIHIFSAQRIIVRRQHSWTRKICEMRVAGSGIEPKSFAFRATALDHPARFRT